MMVVTSIYFSLLLLMFVVYSVILMQFRQSRKRLEELQRQSQSYEYTSKIVFKKNNRTVSSKSEVAGLNNKQIQSISVKFIENEKFFLEDQTFNLKRKSSSVTRSVSVLLSPFATYVLAIVTVYLLTWTPFILFIIYNSFNLTSQDHGEMEDVSVRQIKSCFKSALQDGGCNILSEDITQINQDLQSILHSFETDTYAHILGPYLTLLNSIANPVLYALWYPDFRRELQNIFQLLSGQPKLNKMPDIRKIKIVTIS